MAESTQKAGLTVRLSNSAYNYTKDHTTRARAAKWLTAPALAGLGVLVDFFLSVFVLRTWAVLPGTAGLLIGTALSYVGSFLANSGKIIDDKNKTIQGYAQENERLSNELIQSTTANRGLQERFKTVEDLVIQHELDTGSEKQTALNEIKAACPGSDVEDLLKPFGNLAPDNYVWIKDIGEGATGKVYLVKDKRHKGVRKAFKISIPGMDKNLLARFKQESDILTILQHPNIVRIYDTTKTSSSAETPIKLANRKADSLGRNLLCIEMEYVDGKQLLELIQNLKPVDTINILITIYRALEYAHSKGIIHRDLKPENIKIPVNLSGQVLVDQLKLLDFGLGKLLEESATQHTRAGETAGTPRFMSPEHWRGIEKLTPASDIFCAGLIGYSMFEHGQILLGTHTGVTAYYHAMQTTDFSAKIDQSRHIPDRLKPVFKRIFDKDSINRPSISEIVAELEKARDELVNKEA